MVRTQASKVAAASAATRYGGGAPGRYPPSRFAILILCGWLSATPSLHGGEPEVRRPAAATLGQACAGCHGTFGHSRSGIPSIYGRSEADFIRLMRKFKSGERPASVMNRIAQGYRDEDFQSLARFFTNP